MASCAQSANATTVTMVDAVHDTYVRGGDNADTNYSADSKLRVKNASNEQNDRHTLLRFDLSGVTGDIVTATLQLTCNDLSNGTGGTAFVYSVDVDSWQADTVTWNTAPAANTLLDAQTSISTVGATYSFDVTSFATQEHAGDGFVSFLLRDDLQVAKAVDFDPSDGANPPRLVVETQNQYTLAVTPIGSGQITLSPPGGVYSVGTVVTLTASADAGWQFTSWSGNLTGFTNPETITIDANKTVVAHFDPYQTISLTVSGLGTVALDPPGGLYPSGTVVTATAIPATGWGFGGWTDSLSGTDNPTVLTMTSDHVVGATFLPGAPVPGRVLFREDKNGGASATDVVTTLDELTGVNGDLYLAAISSRPFQPVSSVSGMGLTWIFVDEQCSAQESTGISLWYAQGVPTGSEQVTAQLTAVTDNVAISVSHYAGADTTQPLSVLTSANQNGVEGTCLGGDNSSAYSIPLAPTVTNALVIGAVTHLDPTHTPAEDWIEQEEFHHGSAGSSTSITISGLEWDSTGAVTFAGSFSEPTDWAASAVQLHPGPGIGIQLTTSGLGTVTLSPPGGSYSIDTIVSLTPNPDPGWWFVEWGADIHGHTSPTSVLVSDAVEVSATFSTTPHYDLGVQVNGVGHVIVEPPDRRYADGTPVTLSVEVPTGWIFTGWSGDASGQSVSTVLTMNADRSVSANFSFAGHTVSGLWTSPSELQTAPMAGEAWNRLLAAADATFFPPDVADMTSPHNVQCLAAAIVYARTGDTAYRVRVEQALAFLPSLENPGSVTLAWAREVGAYALAADLIGYQSTALDTWLRDMALTYIGENNRTVEETFLERPNNWGTHAFGMLVAVFAYLQDDVKLNTVRDHWIQSVTDGAPSLVFGELSWHDDPARPRMINPPRSWKQGVDIDGAITDDIRRGGPLMSPPQTTGYPWEALQGLVMAARVLQRYDPEMAIWHVGEKAIYRAARLLQVTWEQQYGGWAATGDDLWMIPFFDATYGTQWGTGQPGEFQAGKNTGWAYVLTGSEALGPPTSSPLLEPTPLVLYRSSPNPFSVRTHIRFNLPTAQHVAVRIYDVAGRHVMSLLDGPCPAGPHSLPWDGQDSRGRRLASGVYWCRLDVGSRRENMRIILLR